MPRLHRYLTLLGLLLALAPALGAAGAVARGEVPLDRLTGPAGVESRELLPAAGGTGLLSSLELGARTGSSTGGGEAGESGPREDATAAPPHAALATRSGRSPHRPAPAPRTCERLTYHANAPPRG